MSGFDTVDQPTDVPQPSVHGGGFDDYTSEYTASLPNGETHSLRNITVNQDTGTITTTDMQGELRSEFANGKLQRYDRNGYILSESTPQKNQVTTFDHVSQQATVTDTRTGNQTTRPMTSKELTSIFPPRPARAEA